MMLSWLGKVAAIGALAVALAGSLAKAQEYPARNVNIVVPLAAGSGMDFDRAHLCGGPRQGARQAGRGREPARRRAHAGGAERGPRRARRAHARRLRLAPMAVNPTLYKKVNYDAEKDFVPLALYAKSPFVLIVNPAFGADTMKDFIKKAQDSANPVTYATTGAGTLQYLTMETLKRDHKFQASHVPYRSPPQIVTDLVGGHIASSISETGAALSLIVEGKLKALGITAATPHPALPQVPTMAEAMGMPGFEAVSWHVLMAPAATPRPIVERLHAEMTRITGDAAFQKRVSDIGLMPLQPRSIEEIEKYIKNERERWGGVVTSLGLAGSL